MSVLLKVIHPDASRRQLGVSGEPVVHLTEVVKSFQHGVGNLFKCEGVTPIRDARRVRWHKHNSSAGTG